MIKSYIHSIGTATPDHCYEQATIASFLADKASMTEAEKDKLSALYRTSGINNRYSVLPDFNLSSENKKLFTATHTPSVSERMKIYKEEALPLSLKAIRACLHKTDVLVSEITHLITVSCTGMYAPGLDIDIVQQAGLSSNVQRTCVNFMGCYAAFNALKLADAICKANVNATVLIVCTELCSLHYQSDNNKNTMISNAIFADGSAAVLLSAVPSSKGITLEGFYCDLEPGGSDDMTWQIADHGFEMTLSAYVPSLIGGGIAALTKKLLSHYSLEQSDIDFYAIHPGGRKILEVIEEVLGISKSANTYAYEILKQFGNMSSATILFVLEKLINDLSQTDHKKNIMSFAFGPGLTLESMLLSVHCETQASDSFFSEKEIAVSNA